MSVAWTTVAVVALLLPGIFFFIGVASYDRLSREIIRSNVIGEVALAIVVALLLHTISITILSAGGFRLTEYLRPLADYGSISQSELVTRDGQRLLPSVIYLLVTTFLGFLAGTFVAIDRNLLKKVYIAAFAVINLQHHCSPAAEGPMINNQCLRIDLANEIARYAE